METPPSVRKCLDENGGMKSVIDSLPPQTEIENWSASLKAAGDPARLKILFLLRRQPLCVCLIKKAVKMSDSKLSYHLGLLKRAGLIEGRQEGSWIIYALTEDGGELLEVLD